ncbi:MAG TPA: hypothetical protein VK673_03795 [Chthoniobacterales bacterium]|nr:hypothetical protein [Chthoniobacterales bacterium]
MPFDEEDFLGLAERGFGGFAETGGPLDLSVPIVVRGNTRKALPAQAPAFGVAFYLGCAPGVTTQETLVFLFLARNWIPREQTNLHGASFYHEGAELLSNVSLLMTETTIRKDHKDRKISRKDAKV